MEFERMPSVDITDAGSLSMSDTESIDITFSDSAERDVRSEDERIEGGRYRGHELGDRTAEASVRTDSTTNGTDLHSTWSRIGLEALEAGNSICAKEDMVYWELARFCIVIANVSWMIVLLSNVDNAISHPDIQSAGLMRLKDLVRRALDYASTTTVCTMLLHFVFEGEAAVVSIVVAALGTMLSAWARLGNVAFLLASTQIAIGTLALVFARRRIHRSVLLVNVGWCLLVICFVMEAIIKNSTDMGHSHSLPDIIESWLLSVYVLNAQVIWIRITRNPMTSEGKQQATT